MWAQRQPAGVKAPEGLVFVGRTTHQFRRPKNEGLISPFTMGSTPGIWEDTYKPRARTRLVSGQVGGWGQVPQDEDFLEWQIRQKIEREIEEEYEVGVGEQPELEELEDIMKSNNQARIRAWLQNAQDVGNDWEDDNDYPYGGRGIPGYDDYLDDEDGEEEWEEDGEEEEEEGSAKARYLATLEKLGLQFRPATGVPQLNDALPFVQAKSDHSLAEQLLKTQLNQGINQARLEADLKEPKTQADEDDEWEDDDEN